VQLSVVSRFSGLYTCSCGLDGLGSFACTVVVSRVWGITKCSCGFKGWAHLYVLSWHQKLWALNCAVVASRLHVQLWFEGLGAFTFAVVVSRVEGIYTRSCGFKGRGHLYAQLGLQGFGAFTCSVVISRVGDMHLCGYGFKGLAIRNAVSRFCGNIFMCSCGCKEGAVSRVGGIYLYIFGCKK
jgi:hypothetical protein